jgi:transcriptional regulator with XRE-family HTH domain
VNQVVAYNVRAARELRGWTQEEFAERLEPYLGQRLTQTSVSAIERAWDNDRRREFDAHELLIFGLVFDLPLIWFLLPPAGDHRIMRATTRQVDELYALVMGHPHQMEPVFARLRELGIHDPSAAEEAVERITGEPSSSQRYNYKSRRKELMLALLDEHADEMDAAMDEYGRRFDHLRQVGIRGFVAEHTNDADFARVGKSDPPSEEPEPAAAAADEAPRGGSGAKAPRKRSSKKR